MRLFDPLKRKASGYSLLSVREFEDSSPTTSLDEETHKVFCLQKRIGALVACLCLLMWLPSFGPNHSNSSTQAMCQKNECFLSEKEILQTIFVEEELHKLKFLNSETRKEIGSAINKASSETGLPKKLIWALIRHESSFKPQAVSSVGAKGLTQLMPGTARSFCGLRADNIFLIEENVLCGSRYLKHLIDDFDGDLRLALAAYNAGPGRVKQLLQAGTKPNSTQLNRLIPPSVRRYISSVQTSYKRPL